MTPNERRKYNRINKKKEKKKQLKEEMNMKLTNAKIEWDKDPLNPVRYAEYLKVKEEYKRCIR